MSTVDYKEQIYKRLEETNRGCDGCDNTIGRFTDKCAFDPVNNLVYCSLGGCAAEYRAGPDCLKCGAKINLLMEDPIEVDDKHVICEKCGQNGEDAPVEAVEEPKRTIKELMTAPIVTTEELINAAVEAVEEVKGKKKAKVEMARAELVSIPDAALFKQSLKSIIETGPFVVMQLPYIYQILVAETVGTEKPKVMATGSDLTKVFVNAAILTLRYRDGKIPDTNQ